MQHLTIMCLSFPFKHQKLGHLLALALDLCASIPLLDSHGFDMIGVPVAVWVSQDGRDFVVHGVSW